MTYKIEKNIPMPDRSGTRAGMYPFSDMEIGDSFFAEGKTSNQLRNAAGHWRKKNGWKFNCESRTEDGVVGARIWRTA